MNYLSVYVVCLWTIELKHSYITINLFILVFDANGIFLKFFSDKASPVASTSETNHPNQTHQVNLTFFLLYFLLYFFVLLLYPKRKKVSKMLPRERKGEVC